MKNPAFRRILATALPIPMLLLAVPSKTLALDVTYSRQNFGQSVTDPTGTHPLPNSNLWITELNVDPVTDRINSLSNWTSSVYPDNGRGGIADYNVTVVPQIDPSVNPHNNALDGVHLNENATINNLTLTTGALLTISPNNSGGVANHPIVFTVAGNGPASVQNDGIITLTNDVVTATLAIANATTLSGSGSLSIGLGAPLVGPGVLTQAAGHTIFGGGDSVISVPLVNAGTIHANGFGNYFPHPNLYLDSATITNTGTLRSSGDSSLVLRGSTINNTGGSITAGGNASGVVLESNVSISGGSLISTGANFSAPDLIRTGNGGASLTNVAVTSGSTVLHSNSSVLRLNGTVVNQGAIAIFPGAALEIASNTTLSGSGNLSIGFSPLTAAGSATLTNAAGHTIFGGGDATISAPVINAGTIDINGFGNSFGHENFYVTGGLTNTGTVRSSGGGNLTLRGGVINNTGGLIAAGGNSAGIILDSGVSITGGTLSSAGTGFASPGILKTSSGAASLTDVSLSAASFLAHQSTGLLRLNGAIANQGVIAAFQSEGVQITTNTVLSGTGSLAVGATSLTAAAGVTLTNGAGHTILGGGDVTISAPIVNAGIIDANGFGNSFQHEEFFVNGTVINQGTLRASTNQRFSLNGALTNYDVATQTLTGGTYQALGGLLFNSVGAIANNAANVELNGTGSSFTPINSLANNQGSFSLLGARNFSTPGALQNSGVINIGTASTLSVNGAFSQLDGGTVTGGGKLVASTFSLSGELAPGNSPGTLMLEGTVNLTSQTLLAFELGGLAGPNDLLEIVGGFTLDGTLNVAALPGFGAGTYDLLNYTGTLLDNGLEIGLFPEGFRGEIVMSANQVELVVQVIPEPTTSLLLSAGCALLVHRRRRPTAVLI